MKCSIGRDGQPWTLLHVRDVSDIALPFRVAQVAFKLGAQAVGLAYPPQSNSLIVATRNDTRAIRTDGDAEDRFSVPSQRLTERRPGGCIPQPQGRVVPARDDVPAVGTEGNAGDLLRMLY